MTKRRGIEIGNFHLLTKPVQISFSVSNNLLGPNVWLRKNREKLIPSFTLTLPVFETSDGHAPEVFRVGDQQKLGRKCRIRRHTKNPMRETMPLRGRALDHRQGSPP